MHKELEMSLLFESLHQKPSLLLSKARKHPKMNSKVITRRLGLIFGLGGVMEVKGRQTLAIKSFKQCPGPKIQGFEPQSPPHRGKDITKSWCLIDHHVVVQALPRRGDGKIPIATKIQSTRLTTENQMLHERTRTRLVHVRLIKFNQTHK